MYDFWLSWLFSDTIFEDGVYYFDPFLSMLIEGIYDEQ